MSDLIAEIVLGVEVIEQPVTCALDVSPRESARTLGVACSDGVEDPLVLLDDIIECQEPVGENLTRAQLDLTHEQ